LCAIFAKILKLGRLARYVVDYQIGHDFGVLAQGPDVIPIAEAAIHKGVVDGIETGVRAVDWMEEWQQVGAAKNAAERAGQKSLQFFDAARGKAVNIGNQLDLVTHLCIG